MAEKRHLQHVRSKVVEQNGQPKLPIASDLVYGELAINYHKGTETVSLKNDNDELVLFHDEVEISSGTPKVNTEIWIDTGDKTVTEVYTKEQIDSQMSGVTTDITSIKSTNQTQDSRLSALEGKDAAHDTRLNEIDALDEQQNGRLSALEDKSSEIDEISGKVDTIDELVKNNIVISSTTPSSDDTELFVDTSNDGPQYEVYTKTQVDAMIAYLQRQIDELKQ
jgi:hypothetical protein